MLSSGSLQDDEEARKFVKGLGTLAKLPLELRHAIYEFSLQEDEAISPVQVAPRSNKFVWGKSIPHWESRHHRSVLLPVGAPLKISTMRKVSSSIRMEVNDGGFFYKVNDFVFSNATRDLASYLAAISPANRSHIRSIVVKQRCLFWGRDWGFAWKLLSTSCVGLRRLVIDLSNDSSLIRETTHGLNPRIRWAKEELERVIPPTLCGLRCFEVLIQSPSNQGGKPFNLAANLGPADIHPDWRMTVTEEEALLEAAAVFATLRGRVRQPRKASDFSFLPAGQQRNLQKWLGATHVTVLGEHRGLLNPAAAGTVSSRTRGRSAQMVDNLGTLCSALPQYKADGGLAWLAEDIVNGRVGTSLTVAEFELVFHAEGTAPERLWVPFHALATPRDVGRGRWNFGDNLFLVGRFYRKIIYRDGPEAERLSDQQVAMLPHPLDLAEALRHDDGDRTWVFILGDLGKAWGERSPRADF